MMTASSETIRIDGLDQPVEIVIDPWGVPHIRAQSTDDLFFAQGFNAARDRLWQLDLWRKRGLGLLAADFGPGYLAQDHASRLFLYRGDMAAEWAAYAPDAQDICTRFVAGINAYIALVEREPDRIPPEFILMHTRPQPWAAEDVVRIRSHGLTRNALSEVLRANVLARADAVTDALRKMIEPVTEPVWSEDIDLGSIPLQLLTIFNLATTGVTFSPERLAAKLDDAWLWTKVTDLGEVVFDAEMTGSNNWVINPSKSATGRPIMANDPHRGHAVPSLRYLVHLSAPGFDAIGAGEPVIPGISLGHNGQIAFGLTIFYSDQEDVYVYDTKPNEPDLYRYGDSWEPMEVIEDLFPVRGYQDQVLPLRFTRHGPILLEDPGARRAYAVRSVWFEPGSAAYMKSLATMRAKDFETYRDGMRHWNVPSSNHVYADISGLTAWVPSGATPIRVGWNGLLPVPGDGRFEWEGFLDNDLLPRVIDPEKGFFATANEMNLPPGFEHEVGYEWIEPSRATRIHEAMRDMPRISVEDSCALQTDTVSIPARRMAAMLTNLRAEGVGGAALAMMRAWNHRLDATSPAAALFEVWWTKHLKPTLFRRLVVDPEVRALIVPGDVEGILQALEHPNSRFGPNPYAARDVLLMATLTDAWKDCVARMGDDPAQWAWGRLHHAYFEHPLSGVAAPEDRSVLDIGPFPHGGSGSTPMHTGYRPNDFRTTTGASVRIVVDVGAWDDSRWINAPGQSGDPRSPHFRDLASIWAAGQYVPMLYSRAAVDAVAEHRIMLMPGS